MNRTGGSWRRSELFAGLLVGLAIVGTCLYFWPRRPSLRSRLEQARKAPVTFAPRMNLDTGGFQLFRDGLPAWSPDASLAEIGRIWQEHCARNVALANSQRPEIHPRSPEDVQFVIAQVLLANCEGQPARAYQLLKQLRANVEQIPPMAEQCQFTLIYLQGVTALRLGEDENCILCRGESSCILPISKAARHTKPRGSRLAIQHFTEYLNQFPDDVGTRWLLNLAHMTLGEYPDKVDPRFLLTIAPETDPALAIGAFQDVGERVGINRYNHAGGGIMDDFDNDGWLDIATSAIDASKHMSISLNTTQGTFREHSAEARLTEQLGGLYCVQADFNNDGFLDIFVPRGAWLRSPIRPSLLMNQGDGTFSDVTWEADLRYAANSNSASWADYNNDGLLDLYVCCERQPNKLYRNRGTGQFVEVAAEAGVVGSQQPMCKGAVWFDYDNDHDPDLFLNYFGGVGMLFSNDGKGTFSDVTRTQGIDGPEKGFSSWAWDYDNDGWLDLFATCYDQTLDDAVQGLQRQPHHCKSNRLFHNRQGAGFENQTQAAGLDLVLVTMGSNYGDFDNDGFLDMYLGTGEPRYDMLVPNRMFRNVAGQRFGEITASSRTGHLQKGHGVACGDWNRDGQTDIFIEMGGASNGDRSHNILFQNPGHPNSWLTLRLVGRKSNRAALGARIKVVIRGATPQTFYRHVSSGSTFGANPLEQTIGLGSAKEIERLEIQWPATSETQIFQDVAVGQVLVVQEGARQFYPLRFIAAQPPPQTANAMSAK